jgi:hypothetical protein
MLLSSGFIALHFNVFMAHVVIPIMWEGRASLDSFSFYKNWFFTLAHKIWFLKKLGWGCLETSF